MIERYLPFTVENLRKVGDADGVAEATRAFEADFFPLLRMFSGLDVPATERDLGRKMFDQKTEECLAGIEKTLTERTGVLRSLGAPSVAVDAYREGHGAAWERVSQGFIDECRRREQSARLTAAGILRPTGHPARGA